MRKLNILALLLFCLSGYAQVNLDSLLRIWKDPSQVDTVRLDAILHLFMKNTGANPDSTLVLAGDMLDFAKTKGLKTWQVHAEFMFVSSWKRKGNYQETFEAAMRALKLSEEIGFAFGECLAYMELGECSLWQGNYPVSVDYSIKALNIAEQLIVKFRKGEAISGHPKWVNFNQQLPVRIQGTLGNAYKRMSAFLKAIESFKNALALLEAEGNKEDIGLIEAEDIKKDIASLLNNIAGIYRSEGDNSMAQRYYAQALKIAEEIDYKYVIVANLTNVGEIYKEGGDYKTALENLTRALKMNAEYVGQDQLIRTGYITREIGAVYMEMKDYAKANKYFDEATETLESIGAKGQLIAIILDKCKMYLAQDNFQKAIRTGLKGLEMAEEVAMIEFQREFCLVLYKAYKALDQNRSALKYYEHYTAHNDSLQLGETGKKLQQMEFSKQMLADSLVQEEKKLKVEMAYTSEINKKNKTRNILLGSAGMVLLMAIGLWSRLNFTRKSKAVLQIEKDRSENLLLNILPAEVVEELKAHGESVAREFEMVSIIFTDFKGFTETSEKLSAGELVNELNYCFNGFDMIMEKYGIEKIKTIGDAYMAAGGLSLTLEDSIKNTVLAALEMQEFIAKRKDEQGSLGSIAFEMRAGIHTGPIVAGIVGVKKFQYDIWGDTVNTASRMESNGEVGQVNISEHTYKLLKDDPNFSFENRGKIKVKGKGELEMYFVELTPSF